MGTTNTSTEEKSSSKPYTPYGAGGIKVSEESNPMLQGAPLRSTLMRQAKKFDRLVDSIITYNDHTSPPKGESSIRQPQQDSTPQTAQARKQTQQPKKLKQQ